MTFWWNFFIFEKDLNLINRFDSFEYTIIPILPYEYNILKMI